MNDRQAFIKQLSGGVAAVKPVPSPDVLATVWFALSFVYVVAVTHYFGPVRANAFEQLFTVPRFLVEVLNGVLAIFLLAFCAFRAAVPGRLSTRFFAISFLTLGLWILHYIVGLFDPALAPSMEGKRHDCWQETMIYTVPPLVLGFVLTRRLYPLNPLYSTVSFCLAAGMLPALYMQLACMYLVPHILQHHLLPGFLVAVVGNLFALFYRAKR